jgi:hypothetical protein
LALEQNTAMHPQAFLKTFWRIDLRPQVFVAMSFAPQYQMRFESVIAPAIAKLHQGGQQLRPYRVDLSKSGDSILTDIMDGIAHSQLVLADVSTIGKDAVTGVPYRNANVLYEVGIALACRQPSEVLLLRDDEDKFLFDVSSIPHMKVDFTDTEAAILKITEALDARFRERQLVSDARVELAVAGLSNDEASMLKAAADYPPDMVWGRPNTNSVDFFAMAALPRLLDKQLIRVAGEFEEGHPAYQATPLGRVVMARVKSGLRRFKADSKT